MGYKLGSLFDGSGGFPLAGSLCGITPVWAAEVEPYPIAVTRSRFPGMRHLGDISKVNGAEIEPVDIITFGSPCQDLSVAGKRAGLKHADNGDDETTRSGLFMEAVRIIREMRSVTNGLYPRFALWENVPGAFSSNKGEDFRTVLQELVQIVEPAASVPDVPKGGWPYADSYVGDGWGIAWRVFDAQYWGVPQRRRRIHLVLDLGGECAREILFEREGLRGYFAPGGAQGEGTAPDAERGSDADHREGENGCLTYQNTDIGWWNETPVGATLRTPSGGDSTLANVVVERLIPIAFTQNQRDEVRDLGGRAGALSAQPGMKQQTYIAIPHAFTVSAKQQSLAVGDNLAASLGANDYKEPQVVICPVQCPRGFEAYQHHGYRENEVAGTLTAEQNNHTRGDTPLIVQAVGADCYNGAITDDVAATINANSGFSANHAGPCVCVGVLASSAKNAEITDGTISPCLMAKAGTGGNQLPLLAVRTWDARGNGDMATVNTITGDHNSRVTDYTSVVVEPVPIHDQQTVCYGVDLRNATEYREMNGTLQAHPGGGYSLNCNQIVRTQYIVRRLTPTECARLQGFPDKWGHPDKKDDFTDEECRFWLEVRNTHAAINGKATKDYTKAQMLVWYNKLHTDSAEYKMWGNGIALPPALYCMQGIVDALGA